MKLKKCMVIMIAVLLVMAISAQAEMETIVDIAVSEASIAEPEQQLSMTTGLPIDHPDRTMVAQMDNEPGARPQKGIASADIVYEIELYDGGYTRYTAVFNDTIPEQIEAIRSARIVNVDFYKEYDGVFIHYGAQYYEGTNAEEYLESVRLGGRYDGFRGHAGFWRDTSRKAPNNVVCELKELYEKTDWSNHVQKSPLKFSETSYTAKGESVNKFSISYRGNSYHPGYEYRDGVYYRYYNGKPFKDGSTGEQITCSNVIVHHVEQWFDNKGGRPQATTYGTNACDYFIDGMHFTGYWVREDVYGNTTYYDDEGNEVIFKPGKTYIQVLKEGKEITIEGTEKVTNELKNGSRGENVKKLQQKLKDMGLLNDKVDGIYGKNTAAAVSAAQAQLGLEQTGVAGEDFLDMIYAK